MDGWIARSLTFLNRVINMKTAEQRLIVGDKQGGMNCPPLFSALHASEKFGEAREGGEPGERCIPASYRLLYFIGWKPDPSQVGSVRFFS